MCRHTHVLMTRAQTYMDRRGTLYSIAEGALRAFCWGYTGTYRFTIRDNCRNLYFSLYAIVILFSFYDFFFSFYRKFRSRSPTWKSCAIYYAVLIFIKSRFSHILRNIHVARYILIRDCYTSYGREILLLFYENFSFLHLRR